MSIFNGAWEDSLYYAQYGHGLWRRFDPRGVWIECAKNPTLDKLASDIRKALEPLGLIPDKPFTAHITLGRYKMSPAHPVGRVKGNPNAFAVSHFELMASELTPKGPIHKSLARFPA